jgi:hypothetical protein
MEWGPSGLNGRDRAVTVWLVSPCYRRWSGKHLLGGGFLSLTRSDMMTAIERFHPTPERRRSPMIPA